MKKQFFYLLALVLITAAGCQKELSFEMGNEPAEGSLQSDINGECLPKTVNGDVYKRQPPSSVNNQYQKALSHLLS